MLSIIKEIAITNITNLTSICEIQNDYFLSQIVFRNRKRINNLSYDAKKYILERSPKYFRCMKNKTFELFKIATITGYKCNVKYAPKKIKNHPEYEDWVCNLLRSGKCRYQYVTNPTIKMKIAALSNGSHYMHSEVRLDFDNLSEELIIEALKQNGLLLKYVKNPTDEMKKIALKQNGFALLSIDDPTDEMKKIAITTSPDAIKLIKNPSDELKLLAVKNGICNIRAIDNPTDEMKILYITENPDCIQFVDNPTYEMKLLALSLGCAPCYCDGCQTYELCKIAIEKYPLNIFYIDEEHFTKKQLKKLYLLALSKDGDLIYHRSFKLRKTKKIVELALKTGPLAFKFVKNQTYEMCVDVINKNKYSDELFLLFNSIWKHPNIFELCKLAIEKGANIYDIKSKYFTTEQLNELCALYIKSNKDKYMPLKLIKKFNRQTYITAFQNGINLIISEIKNPFLKGMVKMIERGYFIIR
jgi:hypothetical protein